MKKGDLVQFAAQRAGISDEQAEKAVDAVLGQLKTRLPAPIAGQLDDLLEGGSDDPQSSGLGDAAKRAGEIFGR